MTPRRFLATVWLALPLVLGGCVLPLKAIALRIGPPSSVRVAPDAEVQAYLVDDSLPIGDTAFHRPDAAARFFPERVVRIPVSVRCGLLGDDGELLDASVSVIVSAFGVGIQHDEVAVFFAESGIPVASARCNAERPIVSFVLVLVPGAPPWDENAVEIEAVYDDEATLLETYFPEYEVGFLSSNPLVDSGEVPIFITRDDDDDGYTIPD